MPLDLTDDQHWFRLWFGAVRQQAITWANVDPDICRQMASLGLNELMFHKGTPDMILGNYQSLCVQFHFKLVNPQQPLVFSTFKNYSS